MWEDGEGVGQRTEDVAGVSVDTPEFLRTKTSTPQMSLQVHN